MSWRGLSKRVRSPSSCDGGDRHRELHAAECLQGVDHRIEAPWLCLLEQLGLQAMQKLGVFGDGPNVLLEDDLLGRGGQHEASEPADMFGPPVRAADVADVVAQQQRLQPEAASVEIAE